jgi:hypothetical protein
MLDAGTADLLSHRQRFRESANAPLLLRPQLYTRAGGYPVRRGFSALSLTSLGYWIIRLRTITTNCKHAIAFPRRGAPGDASKLPSPMEGVGNAGRPMRPQPVCIGSVLTVVTAGHRENTRHSRTRLVLTAYAVLSPATNSSCHRHRRIEGFSRPVGPIKTSADLTPATGARTTRFCRPRTISAKRLSAGCAHPPKHWRDRSSIVRPARSSVAHG